MHKDARKKNIVEVEVHQKCRWKYNKPHKCKPWHKHNKGQWRWRGLN